MAEDKAGPDGTRESFTIVQTEVLADLVARVTHLEVACRLRQDVQQGVQGMRWLNFSLASYMLVRNRALVLLRKAAGLPIPKDLLPAQTGEL